LLQCTQSHWETRFLLPTYGAAAPLLRVDSRVPGCHFDAVIFDLDGVLLDSEPLNLRATNTVLAREGRYLSPEENAAYIGWRYADVLREVIPRLGLRHPPEYYATEARRELQRLLSGPLEPPPGAVRLIDRLDAAGVPRAVGSSGAHAWIEKILTDLGLRGRFAVLVGGDDVPHGKPAPDIFLRCAELLRVPASRCVVIEDSPNGVLAARRAGMAVIGLLSNATHGVALDGCLSVVDDLAACEAHLFETEQ
jgi:HAD superfamily hydrolase (TIGR01509 family)